MYDKYDPYMGHLCRAWAITWNGSYGSCMGHTCFMYRSSGSCHVWVIPRPYLLYVGHSHTDHARVKQVMHGSCLGHLWGINGSCVGDIGQPWVIRWSYMGHVWVKHGSYRSYIGHVCVTYESIMDHIWVMHESYKGDTGHTWVM